MTTSTTGLFFDPQVNGYGGVDFNQNSLSIDEIRHACRALRRDGVEGILATLITAHPDDITQRIERLVEALQVDEEIARTIAGIHIEGPFIQPTDGFRGAHPADAVRLPDLELMKRWIDTSSGWVRMVTLAPELKGGIELIQYLKSLGIVVAAGHCDPSISDLEKAIDAGLSLFTHLGNGCPQSMHRHDNIIQRALYFSGPLKLSFIADGNHVPYFALNNYFRMAGLENVIITTDAMAGAGTGPGQYTLSHIMLDVGEDGVAREPGRPNFAGSAVSMQRSFEAIVAHCGVTLEEAQHMTYGNIKQLLSRAH